MENILYRKQKQQKSLDNGITWIDTGEYRVGEVLENPSNCSDVSGNTKKCRWIALDSSEDYYCDGVNKYNMQVEECTENDIIWTRSGNQRRGNILLEENSSDCGYVNTNNSFGGEDLIYEYNTLLGYDNYTLNGTTYTAQVTPYSTTLSELGITSLKSGSFMNSSISELIKYPSTSNFTTLSNFFNNCVKLTSVDFSGIDTSSVTNLSGMFYYCVLLTSLDLSMFNTNNVWNVSSIFYGCKKLETLNVTGWKTSNITSYSNMFADCDSFKKLIIGKNDDYNWWCARLTESGIVNSASNCSSIIEVIEEEEPEYDFVCQENEIVYQSNPVGIGNFTYHLDGNFYYSYVKVNNVEYRIEGTEGGKTTYTYTLADFNTSSLYSFQLGSSFHPYYIDSFFDTSDMRDMSYMFQHYGIVGSSSCGSKYLNLTSFNTSNVTDMNHMFNYAGNLGLYLANWNTSKVTDMNNMFAYCLYLNDIDLTGWDTSNVTDMSYMFYTCSSLKIIKGIEDLNTSKVTNMNSMFYQFKPNQFSDTYNYQITCLDLSKWDVSNVTNMYCMFNNLKGLREINLTGWNVKKVMANHSGNNTSMFGGCTALENVYLGNITEEELKWWEAQKHSKIKFIYNLI